MNMNSSTAAINKQTNNNEGVGSSRIQSRPSSLPKGRNTSSTTTLKKANNNTTVRKPRPSSASVVRGSNTNNANTTSTPLSKAIASKEGPVTRTSFETGSQVKEELKEKAKLSIRNQRLTERYYLTSLQLLKKVNAGACKDNKERKVAMDRLKLMENLHLQSIETSDLSLLASEENLKKMHKNKYPNIQPKIYEASKNYGAGAEKEREREERERTLNQTNSRPREPEEEKTQVEKPKRTLRGKAPSSTNITTSAAPVSEIEPASNNTPQEIDSSSDESDSDSPNTEGQQVSRNSVYKPPASSNTTQENKDDKPKKTLRGGRPRQTSPEEPQQPSQQSETLQNSVENKLTE